MRACVAAGVAPRLGRSRADPNQGRRDAGRRDQRERLRRSPCRTAEHGRQRRRRSTHDVPPPSTSSPTGRRQLNVRSPTRRGRRPVRNRCRVQREPHSGGGRSAACTAPLTARSPCSPATRPRPTDRCWSPRRNTSGSSSQVSQGVPDRRLREPLPSGTSGTACVVASAFVDARLVAIEGGQRGPGADARPVQIAERPLVA